MGSKPFFWHMNFVHIYVRFLRCVCKKRISWAQSEIPVHDILHKLLNLRHENLPCILDVPSRRA